MEYCLNHLEDDGLGTLGIQKRNTLQIVKYYAIIFKRKSTKEGKLPALILHQLREGRFRKISLLPGSKIGQEHMV